jgi:sulfonate transport system permease protein
VVDLATPLPHRRAALPRGIDAFWRGVTIPSVLILGWMILTHVGASKSPLLVPFERILSTPFLDEAGQNLWAGLAASIGRFLGGFAIGAIAGIMLGVVLGMSRTADRAIAPSLNALRQIALFAWIPLLTAWFGNGETAKIVYIALSAFFPAVLNTQNGLRSISLQYLEVARVTRLSRRQRIEKLLLPGALPSIFIGVQLALIGAWLGTVGAEYAMGNGRGIGTFIAQGREQFRMDIVAIGVIALAVVGYAINVVCSRVFRRLLTWQGNTP